jgi:lipopolysaccharide/colanic/teichoic acid biosynthesis glycosyltransferase
MIRRHGTRQASLLFFGDFVSYILALWLTLLLRYWTLPSWSIFLDHLYPFSIVWLIWVVIFFIADLYGRQSSAFDSRLAETVINAQLAGSLLAIIFFYYVPFFSITPKITLFFDLLLSLGLVFIWRRYGSRYLRRDRIEKYLFHCQGPEVDELKQELENNLKYQIEAVNYDGPLARLEPGGVSTLVLNFYDRRTAIESSACYRLMVSGVEVMSAHRLYEEVFGRIPLTVISEQWFLEHIEHESGLTYRLFKRLMDFVISLVLAIISLPFYPIIALAIFLNDRGPIFYREERVGQGGRIFRITKFSSMNNSEPDLTLRQVTLVGRILRKTRLDELPQLWSVIIGQQSLIGPRPERPEYVEVYSKQIPYYQARHLITPGLSGWAQIYARHSHFKLSTEVTREKLSYDLYYIKNRSLWLDITIALKTIKTLLSQVGI